MADPRVIIADAGPLIALSRGDALPLLNALFGQVWMTDTVRDEICSGGVFPGQGAILAALSAGMLTSVAVDMTHWQPHHPGVDEGEASAITLAERMGGALLVIDDRLGRLEAQSRKLPVIGTAAIIGLAKKQDLIPHAGPLLRALQANGYFLGEAVVREILDRVGE